MLKFYWDPRGSVTMPVAGWRHVSLRILDTTQNSLQISLRMSFSGIGMRTVLILWIYIYIYNFDSTDPEG